MHGSSQQHRAFEQLVHQHDRRLFAYIFSLVRKLTDAEDVFQETCLALWEQFDTFEPGSDFLAWACTVARFRVLKFFERSKRVPVPFSGEAMDRLQQVFVAAEDAELEARREALGACVEKLSQRQQEMLWSSYSGTHAVAELAARLGRTTHSIYSSLKHIRTTLYRCVQQTLAGRSGP